MSQHQQHTHVVNSGNNIDANIPVSEVYWSLVDKADKKFSKIRDLPFYERQRYDAYFYKVFKVYTQLWKFQQENRQKLVEAGLRRWEIGEIASRIAQLYFGQYMRTSEASYLSESYIFYEAILTREYFKEGLDLNLANKQMRFLARFLMVCLVFNKREMMHQLVSQLKLLVDECKRTFQDADFKEWKLVVQEIIRFLKADNAFMNTRPLRYSLVLDPHPDSLRHVVASSNSRNLRLRDAILSSYHHNEVKFSELTVDTFRMLQCLEWEPGGLFYQSPGSKTGASAPRLNHSQDIVDHTLPPNPRKAVLYRPSVTHFVAVLATICEELPSDGVLLLYLSASGRGRLPISLSAGAEPSTDTKESVARNLQNLTVTSDATSAIPVGSLSDYQSPSSGQSKRECENHQSPCLQFGNRGNGGLNCIYPCDLLPFTRRPLVVIIDSESSMAFEAIHGAEKGEPAALLLSPRCLAPTVAPDYPRCPGGSLFTVFLTAPLQAFCILLGFSSSEVHLDVFNNAEKLLSSSLNDWGSSLATAGTLNPVWAQIFDDPFLRRLLLRFLFCQAVLSLYIPTSSKEEFHPKCLPSLPESVMYTDAAVKTAIWQIASTFSVADKFNFSEARASTGS